MANLFEKSAKTIVEWYLKVLLSTGHKSSNQCVAIIKIIEETHTHIYNEAIKMSLHKAKAYKA